MSRRILWLSDSPTLETGYARVTREILRRLAGKGHSIVCLGRGYNGWPYDKLVCPYPIIPTGEDYLGARVFPRAVEFSKPDCVVAFGDPWMFDWLNQKCEGHEISTVGYIPIDGGPLPSAWRTRLKAFDQIVACSKFGQSQLAGLLPGLLIEVIYHGVDTAVFRPLEHRHELKSQHGFGRKFVVGCVARNQMRKQLPSLVKAFARFHVDHPESVLYLHTTEEPGGWVLSDFVSLFGLEDSVILTPNLSVEQALTDEALNGLYNVFDVLVLPTAGEGFGLPILEAMAAGVPAMATEYSSCIELLQGRGELIKSRGTFYLGPHMIENALVDEDDLYRRLSKLYTSPDLMREYALAGRGFAEQLDWGVVVEQWDRVVFSRI